MKLRSLLHRDWFYALVLLLTALLAYGWNLGRLGFYWDGWMLLFAGSHLPTPQQLWDFYYLDRPFSIWTIVATTPLLGLDPLRWQALDLLLRWLGVLGFVHALSGTWPEKKWQARWCGLLLIVFPGFTQQAVTAYNQHWFAGVLFTWSLALMVWGVRFWQGWKLWLALVLAALMALAQMLTMEYFVGLELLRPLLLWVTLAATPNRLRRILAAYLPFGLALMAFAAWRFGYYPQTVTDVNAPSLLLALRSEPGAALRQLLQIAGRDSLFNLLFAWVNAISIDSIQLRAVFSYAVAGLVAAFSAAWFAGQIINHRCTQTNTDDQKTFKNLRLSVCFDSFFFTGLLALLLGGLPVWVTDRQATIGPWSDRFTLATMFGSAMVIVEVAGWFITRPRRQALFLAALLGLASGFQMRTLDNYAQRRELQREYFWQLAWRAPAIRPGTAILGPKVPFGLVAEDSVGYAFNLIYARPLSADRLDYWFFSAPRHRGGYIGDFKPGQRIWFKPRNLLFESDTNHSLVVSYQQGSCLRVLDPRHAFEADLMESEADLLPVSNLGQIDLAPPRPVTPPDMLFGPEPEHGWCYYFEKAELALQKKDWQEAARLGDEAIARDLRTKTLREWLPFIEGYARTGQWDKAWQLTHSAYAPQPSMGDHWCATLRRLEAATPSSPQRSAVLTEAYSEMYCKIP